MPTSIVADAGVMLSLLRFAPAKRVATRLQPNGEDEERLYIANVDDRFRPLRVLAWLTVRLGHADRETSS